MKTIKDFKHKMTIGAKVHTQFLLLINNEYILDSEYPEEVVSRTSTTRFTLKSFDLKKKKYVEYWQDWPNKKRFKALDTNSAEIYFEGGKFIYTFL